MQLDLLLHGCSITERYGVICQEVREIGLVVLTVTELLSLIFIQLFVLLDILLYRSPQHQVFPDVLLRLEGL